MGEVVERAQGKPTPGHGHGRALALSAVDLHRLDLAACVLAHKRAPHDPRRLLVEMATELLHARGEPSVITGIAALIRLSAVSTATDDGAAETGAARQAARLLRALDDPGELVLVRSWLRGDPGQRVGLPTLRRIRRALRRAGPVPGDAPLELANLEGWHDLLDALARSLAIERESEVMIDATLAGDDASAARRRDALRALLAGDAAPGDGDGPATHPLDRTPPRAAAIDAGGRIGRFTILHHLGSGAMGVVYAAYDPELDRKIALKVMHPRARARSEQNNARLLREAQAMARLAHPNVVVVHDVGTHAGAVFLAMEFVRGTTLHGWLSARRHPWPEVVAVFRQAGAGLAAAHAAGLVHRDFKPANAILGEDGRVRVLDFGLCASASPKPDDSGKSPVDAAPPAQGIVGTPAYMAPEQFHGEPAEPASDQFSFCVALYEALYGQRPFPGDTLQSIALAVGRGELRDPPPGVQVPAWLHAVVVRGLRVDPRARFASMEELLRALEHRRTRWRLTAAVAVATATIAGTVGYLSAGPALDDACSGGAQEVASIWNHGTQRAIEQRFAALGPHHAAELWPPIADALATYANDWSLAHQQACRAHLRGEQSEALLDRRMICLSQRKAGLSEAVSVLRGADEPTAVRGLEIAKGLSPIDHCADLDRLADDVPLPDDPDARAAVAELEQRLEHVRILERAGHLAAAVAGADAVIAAAEAQDHRPVLAEALLARARLTIHTNRDWRDDDALLTRAYLTAFGARADETAAEALALRMYRRGRELGQADAALADFAVAREFLARIPSAVRVRGQVLNSGGAMLLAIGDPQRAEQVLRDALSARIAALGPRHVDVAYTLSNLARATPTQTEREALMLQALELFESELGPAHPDSAAIRIAVSQALADPRAAVELLRRGCDALDRLAADQLSQRAQCLAHLAQQYDESGAATSAREAWIRAAELVPRIPADDPGLGSAEPALIRGYAALGGQGRPEAIAALRAEISSFGADAVWWQQLERAELRLCLGLAVEADGDRAAALAELGAAVGEFAALADAGTADVSLQRSLARARVELARLLLGGDDTDRRRAQDLLDVAERWYRAAGNAFAWRLEQIVTLRQGR